MRQKVLFTVAPLGGGPWESGCCGNRPGARQLRISSLEPRDGSGGGGARHCRRSRRSPRQRKGPRAREAGGDAARLRGRRRRGPDGSARGGDRRGSRRPGEAARTKARRAAGHGAPGPRRPRPGRPQVAPQNPRSRRPWRGRAGRRSAERARGDPGGGAGATRKLCRREPGLLAGGAGDASAGPWGPAQGAIHSSFPGRANYRDEETWRNGAEPGPALCRSSGAPVSEYARVRPSVYAGVGESRRL